MSPQYDDETLVAFLDGELDGEQATLIEHELDCNDQLRSRVDSLKQSWDLLVDLPATPANPDLAKSTVELVTLQLEQERQSWWRRWRRNSWLVLCLGCLSGLLLGAVCGQLLSRFFATELKNNLELLADYHSLREIDSDDWLNQLGTIQNLTRAFPPGSEVIGDGHVPSTNSERQSWIEGLSEIDRGLLEDNVTIGFLKEPDPRKEALKEITDQIYQHPDTRSTQLAQVRAYAKLLNSLSGKQKGSLKDEHDLEQRRKRVQLVVNYRMRTVFAETMSAADRSAIIEWAYDNRLFDANELTFADEYLVTDEMLEQLISGLSQDAQSVLQSQQEDDQRDSLGFWVATVMNPDDPVTVSSETLASILEELGNNMSTVDEAERIELLPEEEARRELRRKAGVGSEGIYEIND